MSATETTESPGAAMRDRPARGWLRRLAAAWGGEGAGRELAGRSWRLVLHRALFLTPRRLFGHTPMDFEILIPIWGERYVAAFARSGLRSLLAPGNLPWLGRRHRVKITLLTTRDSRAFFAAQPAFRRAAEFAETSFIEIDDLIALYGANYSVILTRAYNRAMALSPDMVGRNFLYLVGDHVFAENAIKAIAEAMESGHDACLMCSPRVDAAAVAPILDALGTDLELSLEPRELVRLVMAHPHPTLLAKLVEHDAIRLTIAHQFFWRPTSDAMVARAFLLHMLCIRPTRRPSDIAAPCDFAFVADLVPQGRLFYLEDSDRFMAIEVQDRLHEIGFVSGQSQGAEEVAEALSFWVTEQHRAFSTATFVFKAGDSAYGMQEAVALSQPYVDRLSRLLPARLHDGRHHPFWLGALGAHTLHAPPETARRGPDTSLAAILRRLIEGEEGAEDRFDLGLVIADGPGPIDEIVLAHAHVTARIDPARFLRVAQDLAGPEGRVLAVGVGQLRHFLDLFGSRDRVRSAVRWVTPGRKLLLAYEIAAEELRDGTPSRTHLRDLVTECLPDLHSLGVELRVHDLANGPFDSTLGFVLEIAAGKQRESESQPGEPVSETALYGWRGV